MALESNRTNGVDTVQALDVNQFHDLLTGVMTDQPVTLADGLAISGGTGATLTAAGQLAVGGLTVASGSGPYTSAPGILAGEDVTAVNPYHAKAYGVMCDGQFISDGVMNGTTAVLTSASGKFKAADATKLILVPGAGAGAALLTTTIASYQSATQVTLTAASQTAVATAWVTWGTDDTTAWGVCFAAAPVGATIRYSGFSLTTAALALTKSVTLESAGFSELWGTRAQSGYTNLPGVFPFFSGSGIVPCTAGQNGINLVGTGIQFNPKDLLIRFADGIAFLNAGHGIYGVSTAMDGSGHENGPTDCHSDNVVVWGHDGNHYALYSVNQNLAIWGHLRGWGGGGLHIECDSFTSSFGNSVYSDLYFGVFCGGSAHGIHLKSRTAVFPGAQSLLTFIRPQVNILTFPASITAVGSTSPTAAQYRWLEEGNSPDITVISPDLETPDAINSPIVFGTGTTVITPYWSSPPGFVIPTYRSKRPYLGVPTLSFGTGAGTVGSPSGSILTATPTGVPSNDERGFVDFTTSTVLAGADGGMIVTVTLKAWHGIGAVMLGPTYPPASTDVKFYVKNFTSNSFDIWSHGALAEATNYRFMYHVIE
jgi:hypothetical protein